MWLFGTGEVDIESYKMNYGTEHGDFLGQEKLADGHNQTNFGTEQGDFLGKEKLILSLNQMIYGT